MSLALPAPPRDGPLLVGFSGGMDSSVLLHRLAVLPALRARGLRALHVHHGLHSEADAWAAHCQAVCAGLGVPLQVVRVEVDPGSGLGREGAARAARHAAFAQALQNDEILVLAHHCDDQAETFLLRALRGSGVDGLAAMRAWRPYARGWLWRPLLELPRATLAAHARAAGLHWLDDPANADPSFDRNFLRRQVLPLLQRRWPQASTNLARSATLAAQAADLLDTDDATLLAGLRLAPDTLDADALRALAPARRARVLRHWITALGLPPLPGQTVARIDRELLDAPRDANPRIDWHGARLQRWRDRLHAGPLHTPLPPQWEACWDGRTPLSLPTGDVLHLHGSAGFDAPLRVHARRGGERIRLPGRTHSHALKHLLQAAGLPPWRRERLPLLSAADGTLLAAGDGILAAPLADWLWAHDAHLQWAEPG
ncbi:MAG: tRNA lysidine(34) synthetase TilS [Thermomonas sp.]